mmetsp:Transcript_10878/g.33747  ORF Transcript_10878/g.33747 Transcript_10878/m.33747 type:complete len:220 (+) Transcript_10878:875-1534(+)
MQQHAEGENVGAAPWPCALTPKYLGRHPSQRAAQWPGVAREHASKAKVKELGTHTLAAALHNNIRTFEVAVHDARPTRVQVQEGPADAKAHLVASARLRRRLRWLRDVPGLRVSKHESVQRPAEHRLYDEAHLLLLEVHHGAVDDDDVGVPQLPQDPQLVGECRGARHRIAVLRPHQLHRHQCTAEATANDEAETASAQDPVRQERDLARLQKPMLLLP